MEPSPGIGLGRPVERPLQITDLVLLGGPSHDGHSPVLPCAQRADEAAALPSPRVVLSRRLKRYYGRLRRPPGTRPLPGVAGYRARRSDGTTPQPPGRGGPPSSRRHLASVPSPICREVPRGCNPGSPPLPWPSPRQPGLGSSSSPPKAGWVTARQASLDATDRSLAPPKGAFDAGLRRRALPPDAASLLPGLLAATRTGLPPAGNDELMLDQVTSNNHLQLWAHVGFP